MLLPSKIVIITCTSVECKDCFYNLSIALAAILQKRECVLRYHLLWI